MAGIGNERDKFKVFSRRENFSDAINARCNDDPFAAHILDGRMGRENIRYCLHIRRQQLPSLGWTGVCDVCVPKTLSLLMTPRNHLSWRNDRAPVFRRGGRGLAIQVEDPA